MPGMRDAGGGGKEVGEGEMREDRGENFGD